MLSSIRVKSHNYRHVITPSIRATGASLLRCKTLNTAASQHETLAKPSPGHYAGAKDDGAGVGSGDYTSLDSKLDHYPRRPEEPTYQPSQTTLASLLPPSSPANHSSQCSFLAHSRRTGLNSTSTVFTGTRYEYLALSSLRRMGVELAKVGGTGDRGVDLVGFWHLPQWSHTTSRTTDAEATSKGEPGKLGDRIKVVVQCKRISPRARAAKSIGPNVVRELEGAFRGAPTGWRAREGVLGILVSTRAATKGVIEGMKRSERALAWVLLEEVESARSEVLGSEETETADEDGSGLRDQKGNAEGDEADDHRPADVAASATAYKMIEGRIKQILWNQKAKELGLEGLDVVKRYASDEKTDPGDEVVLMWKGKAVEGLPMDD